MIGQIQCENIHALVADRFTYDKFLQARFDQLKKVFPEGFTMNHYGAIVTKGYGYVVGVESCQDMAEAIVRRKKGQFFGYWQTEGREFIDLVQIVSTLEEAIELGILCSQEAIYDLSNAQVISIPYGAFDYYPRIDFESGEV